MRKKIVREKLSYQIGQDSATYFPSINTTPSLVVNKIKPNQFNFKLLENDATDTFTPAQPSSQTYTGLKIGGLESDQAKLKGNKNLLILISKSILELVILTQQ